MSFVNQLYLYSKVNEYTFINYWYMFDNPYWIVPGAHDPTEGLQQAHGLLILCGVHGPTEALHGLLIVLKRKSM